jgi:hypothetical protein
MTTYPAYVYQWSDALVPQILAALEAEGLDSYRIETGADAELKQCLEAAINDQAIDSHLEAVSFTQGTRHRGCGFYTGVYSFDAETLPVLIRRLAQPLQRHWETPLGDDDSDDSEYPRTLGDAMQSLANDILDTLGFNAEIYD